MAHETLIFGYIRGTHGAWEDSFPLRALNAQEIAKLPEEDDYPYLSQGMFGLPDLENYSVVCRTPMIHFGMTVKNIEFGDVPEWISKFEGLLSKLYWQNAEVHFVTDISGSHRYSWKADASCFEALRDGKLQPMKKWERKLIFGSEPILKIDQEVSKKPDPEYQSGLPNWLWTYVLRHFPRKSRDRTRE